MALSRITSICWDNLVEFQVLSSGWRRFFVQFSWDSSKHNSSWLLLHMLRPTWASISCFMRCFNLFWGCFFLWVYTSRFIMKISEKMRVIPQQFLFTSLYMLHEAKPEEACIWIQERQELIFKTKPKNWLSSTCQVKTYYHCIRQIL